MVDIDELRRKHLHGVLSDKPLDDHEWVAMRGDFKVGTLRALLDELATLRANDKWLPLNQDNAENILKRCLDNMKVARDDKCLIDEMRKRGIWPFYRPLPVPPKEN